MEFFCGFFTGKALVKNPLAGANIRFSCFLRQNLDDYFPNQIFGYCQRLLINKSIWKRDVVKVNTILTNVDEMKQDLS